MTKPPDRDYLPSWALDNVHRIATAKPSDPQFTPPWSIPGAEEKLPYEKPEIYPISPELTRTGREDELYARIDTLEAEVVELKREITELTEDYERRLKAVEIRTPGIGFNESRRM